MLFCGGDVQKTIGIIGGASWESTQDYYRLINSGVQKEKGDLDSAKILMYSMNYRPIIELENAGKWDEIGLQLAGVAKNLEIGGAEFIILCCNTLHKVADQIEQSISIPFIHIADVAGQEIVSHGIEKVGLLGTKFTMQEDFYKARLENNFHLEVTIPSDQECDALDKIIYKELCMGILSKASQSKIYQIIRNMEKKGVSSILLGCTELQMLVDSKDFAIPIFDTTSLHAKDAVRRSLGN